ISEQPRVQRDLAVVVAADVTAGALTATINAQGETLLQDVNVLDVYYPEGADADVKSVALGLIFQDKTRTLKNEAVRRIMERMMAALESRYGAHIRGA